MYIIKTGNAPGTNKPSKSLPVCSYENPMHLYENTSALNDGGDELSQNTYQRTNTRSNNNPEHTYSKLDPTLQDAIETNILSTYQNIPKQSSADIRGPYEAIGTR